MNAKPAMNPRRRPVPGKPAARPMARGKPPAGANLPWPALLHAGARFAVNLAAWLAPFWPLGKKMLLVGVLLVGLAGVWVWLFNPRTLPIRTVHVEGRYQGLQVPLQHVRPEALQTAVADLVREGFFGVDIHAVRRAVLALPWAKDVKVYRTWPGELQVQVAEHVPVARWQTVAPQAQSQDPADEVRELLGEEGEVFAPPAATFPAGLPLLQGPRDSADEVLRRYLEILPFFREMGLRIENLDCNARHAWRLVLDNGLVLLLGRKAHRETLQRFAVIYKKTLQDRVQDIKYVDLRYTNGVAVQWRTTAVKG